MNQQKVAITGSSVFLSRYQFLVEAIEELVGSVECAESQNKTTIEKLDILTNLIIYTSNYLVNCPDKSWIVKRNWQQILREFTTSRRAFVNKSRRQERRIHQMNPAPDWILQVFSLSAPLWEQIDIPYAYYLDHTMALAKTVWTAWLPYNDRQYDDFLACEKLAYQRATHLFSMSQFVKQSLIEDYEIDADKITVVGSGGGNFKVPYAGEKEFGSKRIVFNGSDFHRKGGDILLNAFRVVRQEIPDAKLSIIGKTLDYTEPGIENPGFLGSLDAIAQLFLSADLVVAPARWDPFPGFVIEAMNYGVPCIVSTNGGMREIVDDQISGIVLSDLTPEFLSRAIIDLLNNHQKLEELSHNARNKVATYLNWCAVATTIVKTMNHLTPSNNHSRIIHEARV